MAKVFENATPVAAAEPEETWSLGDRVIVQDTFHHQESTLLHPISVVRSQNGCHSCGSDATMNCSACKMTFYCSRDCQKRDWKTHKTTCQKTKKDSSSQGAMIELYQGMHGTVAQVDAQEGMVSVDMDLSATRLRLHNTMLKREPPISETAQQRRAQVQGGRLVEVEGRAMDLVVNCLRYIAAQIFMSLGEEVQDLTDVERIRAQGGEMGLIKINTMTSTAWSFWKDGRGHPRSRDAGVYDHLCQFLGVQLPEDNPGIRERNPPMKLAVQSLEDVSATESWNCRVSGDFWIVGFDQDGTYLIPDEQREVVYQCVGIVNPIWPMVRANNPNNFVMMSLTMIPWYGRLVYDGVLTPPQGLPLTPVARDKLQQRLERSLARATEEGRVIGRLTQLEVPGGSRKGLHDNIASSIDNHTKPKAQGPPTAQEADFLAQLAGIPKSSDASASEENPGAFWVFRRMGYNEVNNPEHKGLIMVAQAELGQSFALGEFSCSQGLAPVSVDILQDLVKWSRQQGTRPAVVGIDDIDCFERLQFLLDHPSAQGVDTRVQYYAPPSAEETRAAMAAGNYELSHGMYG